MGRDGEGYKRMAKTTMEEKFVGEESRPIGEKIHDKKKGANNDQSVKKSIWGKSDERGGEKCIKRVPTRVQPGNTERKSKTAGRRTAPRVQGGIVSATSKAGCQPSYGTKNQALMAYVIFSTKSKIPGPNKGKVRKKNKCRAGGESDLRIYALGGRTYPESMPK